jgi:large subunit ribosomal protein L6
MSRIGKKEIALGDKATAEMKDGVFSVTGPLGTLSRAFKNDINIKIENKVVTLEPVKKTLETNALWGTYASHVFNMVEGVNKAFVERLVVEGIGYKADVKGEKIVMGLGFSHPVNVEIPKGVKVVMEKNIIVISGADKEVVTSFAAYIRSLKKPEPYKGKGIMYEGEKIRRKQGKKTV